MKTDSIRLVPDARQKYVLVRVTKNGEESLVLWGDPNVTWHKEVVDQILREGYEVVGVLGGGWVMPVSDGPIYVWGKSDRYGLAPLNVVRVMVGERMREEEPD